MAPAFRGVKDTAAARGGGADEEVHDDHADCGDDKAKDAFPADDLEGLERIVFENVLFEDELGGGKGLGKGNEKDAEDGAEGEVGLGGFEGDGGGKRGGDGRDLVFEGAGETNDGDTEDDNGEGGPLE